MPIRIKIKTQWSRALLRNPLAVICMALLRDFPQPTPCCKDAGWFQGSVKVVSCDSQKSADLYKKATEKFGEVYPGAKIVALVRRPQQTSSEDMAAVVHQSTGGR